MKTLAILLSCLAMLILSVGSSQAQDRVTEERSAVITDRSGVNSNVHSISFTFNEFPAEFKNTNRHIIVTTRTFSATIPLASIISIDNSGESSEIKYVINGTEKTINGHMEAGLFTAVSSFGKIELRSDKIKKMIFKDNPAAVRSEVPAGAQIATLDLSDGAKILVVDPKIRFRRTSSYGEGSVSSYGYDRVDKAGFEFQMGESVVTVELKDTKSIQFGPNRSVTVTLKSGESATGRLTSDREEILGLIGNFDYGEAYTAIDKLRSIQFEAAK